MEFISDFTENKNEPNFEPLGVSVHFLAEFITSCDRDRISDLTTLEICQQFVIPRTAARQCSYCELILLESDQDFVNAPLAGKATIFLSHCWQSRFLGVVDPLLRRLRSADSAKTFVYFDLFSNQQHSTYSLPFEWYCKSGR